MIMTISKSLIGLMFRTLFKKRVKWKIKRLFAFFFNQLVD
ncbi:hypothetical protein PROPEN_02239 [Proteus penneri ATCC 35198]|nr:hypothetical protein PROPEN_02239 [Proteus penneri ATCC 35198]